jgi:hypothetical protein
MAIDDFTTNSPAGAAPATPISESPSPTEATESRYLTTSYFQPVTERRWPTRNPAPMPYLRLQGRWLERAGFAVGSHVRVSVESRRLVIEVVEDAPPSPQVSSRPSRLERAILRAMETDAPMRLSV